MLQPIPDLIKNDLLILFVGFNPSIISSQTGHHFANPRNRFWKILKEAGITPRKYSPEEDAKLLDLGFGFTNIVSRPTKAADEISSAEYEEGRTILLEKITRHSPKIVCFVGKGVYVQYSGKRNMNWGVQPESMVEGTIDFVAPSSSGLVRMKIEEIVSIYKELPALASLDFT